MMPLFGRCVIMATMRRANQHNMLACFSLGKRRRGQGWQSQAKDQYQGQKAPKHGALIADHTLNLKCITSPSATTYSLPSWRSLPASLAAVSPPRLT